MHSTLRSILFVSIFFMSIGLRGQETQSSRAMFHGNERLSGVYATREYKDFGNVKWKFTTQGKVFSSPAIVNGVAFIGSEDRHLYAINSANGKLLWKFKTGGAVHSSPAVYQNTVYIGSMDGFYYGVDATTGKEKWKVKTGGESVMGGVGYWGMKPDNVYLYDLWDYFLSSPVVNRDDNDPTVFFGSSDGKLYSVNAHSGTVKWTFQTEGSIHSTPALWNGNVYFGSWDSNVYAVDAQSGQLKWKFKSGDQPGMTGVLASPAVDNGVVYIGSRDANFYALNAENGAVIWTYNAQGSWILSTAAIHNGVVYTTTSDSFLFIALDAKTGTEKFKFRGHGYLFSSPAIVGETAYFGDFTGKMYALDLRSQGKSQKEWVTDARKKNASGVLLNDYLDFNHAGRGKDLSIYQNSVDAMQLFYSLGPIVSSPVVHNGVLFFGSADGNFYAIKLKQPVSPK